MNKQRKVLFTVTYNEMGIIIDTKAEEVAQPERKTGTWIYCEDMCGVDGYRCNKCGFHVPWDYTHKLIDFIKDYRYCPNCGADMRGEEDG